MDPTESNILTTIKTMVKDIPEYSFVFFHYSGHGVSIKDNSGDELDGKDEALYTSDGKVIVDDDLYIIFVQELLKKNCKCLAIVDACHSASAFDLPFNYNFESKEWTTEKGVKADRLDDLKSSG